MASSAGLGGTQGHMSRRCRSQSTPRLWESVPAALRFQVCDFIHQSTVPLLPTQYYCGLKYNKAGSATKCNADSLCKYDDRVEGCMVSVSDRKVASIGFEVHLPSPSHCHSRDLITGHTAVYRNTTGQTNHLCLRQVLRDWEGEEMHRCALRAFLAAFLKRCCAVRALLVGCF